MQKGGYNDFLDCACPGWLIRSRLLWYLAASRSRRSTLQARLQTLPIALGVARRIGPLFDIDLGVTACALPRSAEGSAVVAMNAGGGACLVTKQRLQTHRKSEHELGTWIPANDL